MINIKINKSIIIVFIILGCISMFSFNSFADENIDIREKEPFEDMGENYYKEASPEDILIAQENGIPYVKNQLLISALMGTDKKVIENIAKELNADIVGYIELTSDYQIEFREDKTLDELEKIADYIDSFSFVSSVTLNIVTKHDVQSNNADIISSDTISEWAKTEVEKAIENNLIPRDLQNNYKNSITRKDFAELVVAYIESKKGQSIEDVVKENTNKEISVILETEKFNDTDNKNVIYAKVLGILCGVGENNFNPKGTYTREQAYITLYRLFNL